MTFFKKGYLLYGGVVILSILTMTGVFWVSLIEVKSYYSLPLDTGNVEITTSDSSDVLHYAVGKEARRLIYLTLWLEKPDISYQVDIMLHVYETKLSYDINITAKGIKIMIPYDSAGITIYSSNALTYEQYLAENNTTPEYEDPKQDYLSYYRDSSTELIFTFVKDDYVPSRSVFLDNIVPVLVLLVIISVIGIFGYLLNLELITKKTTIIPDTYPQKQQEQDRSQRELLDWERVPTLLWASSLTITSAAIFTLFLSSFPRSFYHPLLHFLLIFFTILSFFILMGYIGRYISNKSYYLQFLLASFFGLFYSQIFSDQIDINRLPLSEYWLVSTLVLYLFSPILYFYSLNKMQLLYRDAWRRILFIGYIFLIPLLLFGTNQLLFR